MSKLKKKFKENASKGSLEVDELEKIWKKYTKRRESTSPEVIRKKHLRKKEHQRTGSQPALNLLLV